MVLPQDPSTKQRHPHCPSCQFPGERPHLTGHGAHDAAVVKRPCRVSRPGCITERTLHRPPPYEDEYYNSDRLATHCKRQLAAICRALCKFSFLQYFFQPAGSSLQSSTLRAGCDRGWDRAQRQHMLATETPACIIGRAGTRDGALLSPNFLKM